MVKTVLKLAERPELAFVDDQRGSPTFTADLAVAARRLAVERRPGVFHVTNQGEVSWYEFVQAILESAGHDPGKVRPIKTEDLDGRGRLPGRPTRSSTTRRCASATCRCSRTTAEPRPPGRPPDLGLRPPVTGGATGGALSSILRRHARRTLGSAVARGVVVAVLVASACSGATTCPTAPLDHLRRSPPRPGRATRRAGAMAAAAHYTPSGTG